MAVGLLVLIAFFNLAQIPSAYSNQVKELNFVFLHGAGGNTCTFQLLEDYIVEQLPAYILTYEQADTNSTIQLNTLKRCYPGYADVETWAYNIADSIDKHFEGKDNIILVGGLTFFITKW